jgi:hypothetical protein
MAAHSIQGGMSMRTNVITVAILLVVLFFTGGCAKQPQETSSGYEAENVQLRQRLGELEAEFTRLQEQYEKLTAKPAGPATQTPELEDGYEALLRELFSEDELRELAVNRGMSYVLSVNNVPVTGVEVATAAGDMLAITVSEGMVMHSDGDNSLLPNKILQLAMLSSLTDHIRLETDAEFFTSPAAGTVVWGEGFFFENAPAGTTVKIIVSELLRGRLGLSSCEIIVKVK